MDLASRGLKLGPEGFRKIGIIGSAPSSVRLAPYNDPQWALWGCSPGVYGVAPYGRIDTWWEVHRYEPPTCGDPNNAANKGWFSPEYDRFLKEFKGPVFMASPVADVEVPVAAIPNSVRVPFEDYVAKYGPYFFASSMSYMLVHAIETLLGMRKDRNTPEAGEAIGLWGVDMAAASEYAWQRPGCQHFIGLAKSLGIDIVLPPESDLMQPPSLYGICEYNPRHAKLLARMNEMDQGVAHWTNVLTNAQQQLAHVKGAQDNLKYVMATWIDDPDPGWDITSAVSMVGVAVCRPEAKAAALEVIDGEGVRAYTEQELNDIRTEAVAEYLKHIPPSPATVQANKEITAKLDHALVTNRSNKKKAKRRR